MRKGASFSIICRRSLHICVVGSGPAGFYTTEKLLKRFKEAKVDIIERLPTPFGLVRSGVAPDHPETKNVINQFSRVAADERCSFFGNVNVGKNIAVEDLQKLYNVVILAYGAESDRVLEIPGEDLSGIYSAREFVWWYNGHPDCADLPLDLQSTEVVAILGQGNVALDIARILLRPVEELLTTDITTQSLEALKTSQIRKLYLIGRRGPVQAACTTKELREILGIRGVNVKIKETDLTISSSDLEEMNRSRLRKRVYDLFCNMARSSSSNSVTGHQKELHFVFFRQPVIFLPSADGYNVAGVRLEKTILKVNTENNQQYAAGTGILEDIECGLVLKSIGYKSVPLPGLPFDCKKGIIPNCQGRVLRENGTIVHPGLYVAGWLKRGPTGIIGTNLLCAEEVVQCIVEDKELGVLPMQTSFAGNMGLKALLEEKNIRYTSFSDWLKIDGFEIAAGSIKTKSREKITSLEDMLKVAGA